MNVDAMVLRGHGGPEVLHKETIPLPPLGPREVRVRLRAVALNHLDLWVRRGLPHLRHEYPHRLGADMAGEVEAMGDGARGVKVGDRIVVSPGLSCGLCKRCLGGEDNLCKGYRIFGENTQGGYATHIHVPDENLLPMPSSLSYPEAAAVPLVFLTAWHMLVGKGSVKPGDTVLVHGAGSGVSTAAIQIAKLFQATVIATTRSPTTAERARSLGADHTLITTQEDFVTGVRTLTDRRGADIVIEHVGGETFEKSILATAWGGRIVTCGATSGFSPKVDLRHIFFRQVSVLGSTMGPKASLFSILDHVGRGTLRPIVDRVMPLWEAAEAHRVLEAGGVFGKIVLET